MPLSCKGTAAAFLRSDIPSTASRRKRDPLIRCLAAEEWVPAFAGTPAYGTELQTLGCSGCGGEAMVVARAASYDRASMAIPLTTLNRYILRQCLSMMLFVTAALSAAVWLAQSLRLIDLIVNLGLSI